MGEKIIGILGGMGPEATADLFHRIIQATPVTKDQDHHHIIIDSNSKIEDRTPAIQGTGPSPLPKMTQTALNLQQAGADFIIIPCNTAHHYHKELQQKLDIPILHMINLSAKQTKKQYPQTKKAGLLATDGTITTQLYHKAYKQQNIQIITPTPETQKTVMKAIYTHIKTGNHEKGKKLLTKAANQLIQQGSETIICGCTEVSLVIKDGDLKVPVLDPLQTLAEQAVAYASA